MIADGWRGAALTRAPLTKPYLLYDWFGPKRVRNRRLPGITSAWLLPWLIERRHWVKASRWVILGSRLLSRFPVATRDKASYRQCSPPDVRPTHTVLAPS
jgi:hypothetical protein